MGMIGEKERKKLTKLLEELPNPVRLVYFTQEQECEFCKMNREILKELVSLSSNLTLEVHDFLADAELAKQYQIDKIPATLLLGKRDAGIRFFGIPAGYEFTTLIEDIVDVSRDDANLPEGLMSQLTKIDRPVHIQVMVSPTCPYCPAMVRTAHRMAMASPHIRADMVEVSEFPYLAVKYHVQGVPHMVINEEHSLVGPHHEREVVQKVLGAITATPS